MTKCNYPKEDKLPVRTNGDWIRSLNDKELADFICNISKCHPDYCPAYELCMHTEDGVAIDWIMSEFKEQKEEK